MFLTLLLTSTCFTSLLVNSIRNKSSKPTVNKLQETQRLLKKLAEYDPIKGSHLIETLSDITRIGDIYRESWFDEQYVMEIPGILNTFYHKMNETNNQTITILTALTTELNLVPINEAIQFIDFEKYHKFDDATKALLKSSKEIAMSLMFDTIEPTANIRINYMKLIYTQTWQYLSTAPNASLPPMESTFNYCENAKMHSQQMENLLNLISEFDLTLIHPKYLHQQWINVALSDYNDAHKTISEQRLFGNDQDLSYQFDAKYILKILEDIDKAQYVKTEIDVYQCFWQNLILPVLHYFYFQIQHKHHFETFLFGLKDLNELRLLQQFSLQLSVGNEKNYIYFVSELCYVIIDDGERLNDMNRERCAIVAESAYLWSDGKQQDSMREIEKLCDKDLFYPDLFQKIVDLHKYPLVNNKTNYLEYMLLNLCLKRDEMKLDWRLY